MRHAASPIDMPAILFTLNFKYISSFINGFTFLIIVHSYWLVFKKKIHNTLEEGIKAVTNFFQPGAQTIVLK